MKKVVAGIVFSGLVSVLITGCGSSSSSSTPKLNTKAALGEQLYSDKNLSRDSTQSCATCHNPEKGFIDDRENASSKNGVAGAGSLGDNGTSIGDRNAPIAAYAAFSPEFKKGTRQRVASQRTSQIGEYDGFLGGQFWDGREADLKGQAGGPPTNPGEMNMPSKAAVVDRLKANAEYVEAFERLYDSAIFDDTEKAYAAMAESIGEFEKTKEFFPFDSKYDRSLLGTYEYPVSSKAILGKTLFFSSDLTCAACHQLREIGNKGEIFTSFEYHNIGVPENVALRAVNGVEKGTIDQGLFLNPAVDAETEKGKFKVPTLRNIAVTAPYMHNGVFQKLDTVIRFYEHAKTRALKVADTAGNENNPETNLPWAAPEQGANLADDLLAGNDKILNDQNVEALECFFLSLTDARYESLLDPAKVTSCGL